MSDDQRVIATPESGLTAGVTYEGKTSHIGDEPINTLLACGNMGGFRIRGSVLSSNLKLVVLFTTFADDEWRDSLDEASGKLIYFGDNKKPGQDLHATSKGGNELLRWTFRAIHIADQQRISVPPFFVFSKQTGNRAAKFLGVAAPGGADCSESDDLVATWTTAGNDRFQNYRAIFTILDIPTVSREWIRELEAGGKTGPNAPSAWTGWQSKGTYRSRNI